MSRGANIWDLYEDCAHLAPDVAAIPYERAGRRIRSGSSMPATGAISTITDEDIRRSRRAYFANISYIDDKIGEVLDALDATRQAEDTVIVFLSDHGDMLGERGLWFKMSFFEGSARVPLMIAAPGSCRPAASMRRSAPSTCCRRWPSSPASTWTRSCPGPTARA